MADCIERKKYQMTKPAETENPGWISLLHWYVWFTDQNGEELEVLDNLFLDSISDPNAVRGHA